MSCGGRVYKGDTVTISVPFDVDDYSNLTITYTTIGGEKIVKTQEEVEIEDGFITYTFEPGELDLLPDGVIYYAISYEVDGVGHVESTNTNLYLKTPAGYSGRTAEDIYQEGYEAGLEDCSGSSCNLQSKSVVVSANTQTVFPDQGYDGMDSVSIDATSFGNGRYQQGYEAGYDSGYEDAEEDYPRIQPQKNYTADTKSFVIVPDAHYDAMGRVNVNATPVFNQGYQSGLTACSGETPCDCTEAYQSGITYQKSLLSAITIIANGTYYRPDGYDTVEVTVEDTPQLEVRSYNIDENWNGESGEIYPNTQLGFVGFRYFQVFDIGYGQKKYDDGYQSGYTEGYDEGYDDALYEKCNLTTALVVVPSGSSGMVSNVTPPSGYTGFETVSVNATEYGQEMFDNGFQSGYTSGYTDGYNQGTSACASELYVGSWCVDSNWDGEETTLKPSTHFASTAAGFSAVTIYDCGYGDKRFNEGHASGYTDGHASGYTEGYDDGYLSGASTTDCSQAISMAYDNGHYLGYNEGKDSVIKSLLTENDTDLVIGYYYTSARTMCLITGEYHDSNIDYDGNSAFVSMSVNGGSWQPVEKYLELPAGWSQVRFSGCTTLLLGAFSHRFTPSQQCDMDALKIVSLPTMVDGLSNTYTFHMNDGLRVIASSCGIMRGATNGADNINVLITHYTGNQREYNYFPSNGVLFIPEGSTADWASILPNWTHIEMF